ncbi:hypothetical protein ADK91_32785 [Streptomyces sp. XY511]|uniref:hypothetical protein n=1 Tax=Streptomyces sp. XY511 TaxID=1519480 RepID=UPI0006ADA1D8|nr:hypothetical protein [Streptomyces sp. XY511]KOU97409.1 hypothetical protein ADK91_32785 [Streptomyces sp. XY511]
MQPVHATLLVGSVSAVVSVAAVVATHWLARGRERRHKIWDRRMDTYAEVLRSRDAIARTRRNVLRTKKVFEEWLDPDHDRKTWALTEAKLKMFGTDEVLELSDRSYRDTRMWTMALLDWHRLTTVASVVPDGKLDADDMWEQVETLTKIADESDTALADAIKREVEFKKAKK